MLPPTSVVLNWFYKSRIASSAERIGLESPSLLFGNDSSLESSVESELCTVHHEVRIARQHVPLVHLPMWSRSRPFSPSLGQWLEDCCVACGTLSGLLPGVAWRSHDTQLAWMTGAFAARRFILWTSYGVVLSVASRMAFRIRVQFWSSVSLMCFSILLVLRSICWPIDWSMRIWLASITSASFTFISSTSIAYCCDRCANRISFSFSSLNELKSFAIHVQPE